MRSKRWKWIGLGAVAAIAVGWGQYFNDLIDDLFGWKLPDAIASAPGDGGTFNVPAVIIVLAVAGVLILGVRESARANTIMVFIKLAIVSLFIGAMAAYALARFRFRGQRVVLMFLITTQMFPLVLLCIPYFRLVVKLGLYDTLTSLIVVYVTFTLPFCILMLRSYFAQIPKDMEEAAMVDGCSRVGAIVRTQ